MTAAYRHAQRAYFAQCDEAHFRFQTGESLIAEAERLLLGDIHAQPGQRLLEIGCGEGANLFHVAGQCPGVRLTGLDFSPAKAAFARRHLRAEGVPAETFAADATCLPLPDATFDVVLIRDLLHHLPDRAAALREAFRVLRPGGRLIVIEPNRRSPLVLLQTALIQAERGALSAGAADIAREIREAGFVGTRLRRAQPMPVSRALLHPRFGLPRLAGFVGLGGHRLDGSLRRLEALLGLILPRSIWLYLCYTARRSRVTDATASPVDPPPSEEF